MSFEQTKTEVRLKSGDTAPDFTLKSHNEGELNLAWYQGRKNVIVAFYPGDWTPVCSNQIPNYQNDIEKFEKYDTQILAISVDSVPCHKAWAKSLGGVSFPIMADYFPHGEVARSYGVLLDRGYADRVIFIIDKSGIIRFVDHVPLSDLPNNDKLFEQLEKLNG